MIFGPVSMVVTISDTNSGGQLVNFGTESLIANPIIPADGDDDLWLDPGEDLVAGGGRVDEHAAVDGDAHEAEEGHGRVGVEEHGEDLAAEAALAAYDPIPVTRWNRGHMSRFWLPRVVN